MKKTRIAICALLLLLLLAFSLLVNQAEATTGRDWGYAHAGEIHVCDAGYPAHDYELAYVQWACNDIFNYAFDARIYHVWWNNDYYEWGKAYGHLWNYMQDYRSQTTVSAVLGGIDDSEAYHDESTFLYIGHHKYEYFDGAQHYGFFMNGYNQWVGPGSTVPYIWDTGIRLHAQDNHHLVFLWVCRNGNERGQENNPPYVPANGMPHCWTQGQIGSGNGIPTSKGGTGDGYENADGSGYCVISFESASPMLSSWMGTYGYYGEQNLYKHWLCFFYYYALYSNVPYQWYLQRYTVKDALNLASTGTGFPNGFSQSILYVGNDTWWPGGDGQNASWYPSQMRIFGDGNIYAPGDIFDGGGPLG